MTRPADAIGPMDDGSGAGAPWRKDAPSGRAAPAPPASPRPQASRPDRRRLLASGAAGVLAPLVRAAAAAQAYELRLVSADDGGVTQDILQAAAQRLPHVRVVTDPGRADEHRTPAVYAPLGLAALRATLRGVGGSAPVLALFVSREAYVRVLSEARAAGHRGTVCALFADPHPLHQLRLARALYKRRITVATLLSAATAHLQPIVEEAAAASDVESVVRLVEPGESAVRALNLQRDVNALLMVPDPELYTPASLRDVLEAAYRRERGVIGFSEPLVRAGTLAAAFSSIDDVLAQVGALADELASGRPAPAQYPAYWRVRISDRIARSLNIVVAEADRALGSFPPPP